MVGCVYVQYNVRSKLTEAYVVCSTETWDHRLADLDLTNERSTQLRSISVSYIGAFRCEAFAYAKIIPT